MSSFINSLHVVADMYTSCRGVSFCISEQVDDLTRQLNDSNAHKSRLTQENFELQKALQVGRYETCCR